MKVFFAAIFALCLMAVPAAARDVPGVSPVYAATAGQGEGRKVSVLFIGNSYIYNNNLPKMLADLASSDAGGGVALEIQSVTKAGGTLKSHREDGRALRALSSRPWDYVVLQEQSLWALSPFSVEETAAEARAWAEDIGKAGAKPVIFVTWARQPGSFWYTDRKYAHLKSPKDMQEKLDKASKDLAAQIDAIAVPVGEAFSLALRQNVKWPLYCEDSSNPSAAGTYLAALMFYQSLSGRPADAASFVPHGVSTESAAMLRTIAASLK